MRERLLAIETPSGRMETFVTHPEQDGPFPPVIIYMDIWGVREELFEIARRVGTVGYYCLVPDLYYRQGKVRHEFRRAEPDDLAARARRGASPAGDRAGAPALEPDGRRRHGRDPGFRRARGAGTSGRRRCDRLLHGWATRAVRRRPLPRADRR